ncbi:sugar phosphate isomerase/epimerase family protein [Carboxydochorda subterranea]|uniref:Sugar phosphate isomerase/epimerase family protein n=1 Tax=Carboxydichorda subterranea TaxID=3109565 RepID=A0ABZ1BZF8_9FIRM|nr:sugar phosphate isomerase/epimerase family protein [Limnochorda sp. L945t]WRP17955.1 sugar phosphate isomerase/epimerase family protein [Limnochorda sp. L945t]
MGRLGFITDLSEEDFRFAADEGLVVEYNVNDETIDGFLAKEETISRYEQEYGVAFSAIGRFGRDRISDDPAVRNREEASAIALMEWCARHRVPTFVCGAGPAAGRSMEECARRAVDVFGRLVEVGRRLGVRVAVYNCDWGNCVDRPSMWEKVHGALPGLGIKYDPSHAIYGGRDYLAEAAAWGHRFVHFHAKDSLPVGGKRFTDPPAGMGVTAWGPLLALLYHHGYWGDIIIEPHAEPWVRTLRYPGIRIARRTLEPFLIDAGTTDPAGKGGGRA